MAHPYQELRVSNDAVGDAEELRRRMADEGYLFIKGLQDADKLWSLRREMLTTMQRGGWVVAGTDPMDGIADVSRQCTEGDMEYTDVYHEVYRLEAFHRSAHWPDVIDFMEKVVGGPVLPHPQKVARLWFPKFTRHTTPVHQDFVHFQGNFETYTCWAPVGDCPVELGGLAVLPGSHKVGKVLDHKFSLGAGWLKLDTDDAESEWHTTDYEVGDTLIFPALTVHQALPNVTEDRLRVSLDNRYQSLDATIADHVLTPHLDNYGGLTWEEVYRDWEADDLKYYWQHTNTPVVERDASYFDKGFDEALELAKAGNEDARLHLSRIMRRDPSSEYAEAARVVLGVE